MAGFRTPLGRARGLGSAKSGVAHFIGERVSSVALVPLVLWGMWAALGLAGGSFNDAVAWVRSPINASLTILLALTSFYHMQLGMRVIIEDYIERHATKAALLLLNLFFCCAAAVLTALSVLKVAAGGGAT
jgi:succinate dehydrogenase / fumarate reductase membrane anchor subunit